MGDGRKWAAEEAEEEQLRREKAIAEQRNALREAAQQASKDVPVPVPYTPRRVGEPTVGVKYDSGKPRWELLMEMLAAVEVVKGLTYGANGKYNRGNYLKVAGWRWRYVGAAGRHISSYLIAKRRNNKDEEIDQESGVHHLALAICSLLMLLDNELNNMPNGDDEPEKAAK